MLGFALTTFRSVVQSLNDWATTAITYVVGYKTMSCTSSIHRTTYTVSSVTSVRRCKSKVVALNIWKLKTNTRAPPAASVPEHSVLCRGCTGHSPYRRRISWCGPSCWWWSHHAGTLGSMDKLQRFWKVYSLHNTHTICRVKIFFFGTVLLNFF